MAAKMVLMARCPLGNIAGDGGNAGEGVRDDSL